MHIDPYLLPPVEAKFSVDDPVGRFQSAAGGVPVKASMIDVGLVTQVYPWIIGRCDPRPKRFGF